MRISNPLSTALLLLTGLIFSGQVYAEAGRVVFAYGEVTAESPDGVVRVLQKRSHVESGDTIRTSSRSLVQMRMIDKAFIALRPNSTFKIEKYNLGAKKEEDVGFFALLKGGFRSVTGIIGKRLKSSYRLSTVTATIGIRGTDYTARLCQQDCSRAFGNLEDNNRIDDGLYVGVNQGGINLTNDLGTLDLDELQFGYVKDATSAPVALASAPEFLYFNSRPPNPDDEQASSSDRESAVESTVASRAAMEPPSADLTTDDTIKQELNADNVEVSTEEIEQTAVVEQQAETSGGDEFSLIEGEISSSRMIVSATSRQDASAGLAAVHSNPYSSAEMDASNDLKAFEQVSIDNQQQIGAYSTGSGKSIDLGYDPLSGIAWGRWAAGQTTLQNSTSASQFSSLHWVASPDQPQNIALPSSGSAEYQWIGNTTPTDNQGNSGVLGNASLNANFTNMTVDVGVDVGINNQVWSGQGSGLAITENGGFSGNLSSVTVNTGAASIDGSGSAGGFFTQNGSAAAFGFDLQADVNGATSIVNGTAIFQKP